MKRVTGIGGIFFCAKDPAALQAWYKRHLGIDVLDWGGAAFRWIDAEGNAVPGTTIWSIGSAQSNPFAPSTSSFMAKWPLRYLIRHTAFHTMDHAWEMEDKDLTGT
jgi:hypothetical protein